LSGTSYVRNYIYECYTCPELAPDCDGNERRCVTNAKYQYCSNDKWVDGYCDFQHGEVCSNGYCSKEDYLAICGDNICSPGEEGICELDCEVAEEDKTCPYVPSKPCNGAIWNDYPSCDWDISGCRDDENDGENNDVSGCVNKPIKPCGGAIWNDYPYCYWDMSNCAVDELEDENEAKLPECEVNPEDLNKPCMKAVWVGYPGCYWNTDACKTIYYNSDRDGDGILDVNDDCKYDYAQTYNGCPKEINQRKTNIYIAIATGVVIMIGFIAFAILWRKRH